MQCSAGNWKETELDNTSLEVLKKYEKDMQSELRLIRTRIKELEPK